MEPTVENLLVRKKKCSISASCINPMRHGSPVDQSRQPTPDITRCSQASGDITHRGLVLTCKDTALLGKKENKKKEGKAGLFSFLWQLQRKISDSAKFCRRRSASGVIRTLLSTESLSDLFHNLDLKILDIEDVAYSSV